MSNIRRFTFDTDFDPDAPPPGPKPGLGAGLGLPPEPAPPPEPEPDPGPPPPPPEPTFTLTEVQQQLQATREAAYQGGHADGMAAGMAAGIDQTQVALTAVLNQVQGQLTTLIQETRAVRDQRTTDTTRLAMAVVAKLFPALARRHGLAEVEAIITTFLTELSDEPKLLLRVNEAWMAPVKEKVDEMAMRCGFAGVVTVVADPRCGDLDCRAEWGDGGAERDMASIWGAIDTISGRLAPPMPVMGQADAPAENLMTQGG